MRKDIVTTYTISRPKPKLCGTSFLVNDFPNTVLDNLVTDFKMCCIKLMALKLEQSVVFECSDKVINTGLNNSPGSSPDWWISFNNSVSLSNPNSSNSYNISIATTLSPGDFPSWVFSMAFLTPFLWIQGPLSLFGVSVVACCWRDLQYIQTLFLKSCLFKKKSCSLLFLMYINVHDYKFPILR